MHLYDEDKIRPQNSDALICTDVVITEDFVYVTAPDEMRN